MISFRVGLAGRLMSFTPECLDGAYTKLKARVDVFTCVALPPLAATPPPPPPPPSSILRTSRLLAFKKVLSITTHCIKIPT